MECLPKCPVLPKEQLRWNTNEVGGAQGDVGGSQEGMWGHGGHEGGDVWTQEWRMEATWDIREVLGDVGGDAGTQGRGIKGTRGGGLGMRGTWGRSRNTAEQATSRQRDDVTAGVGQQSDTAGGGRRTQETEMGHLSPQEIASYLITFEKHDEWLSCSPKTRWEGPRDALGVPWGAGGALGAPRGAP